LPVRAFVVKLHIISTVQYYVFVG